MAKPAAPREAIERNQASPGRGMFAGAEGGRRIDHDADRAARHDAAMVRPIDKEPADTQWREGELVLCQPVASLEPRLSDLDEHALRGSRSEGKPRREARGQHRRRWIRLDAPLLRRDLKG